jgi:hypothetical protein
MLARRLIVPALSLLSFACSDLALNPSALDGTYRGTFAITNSKGVVQTGNVTFTFDGGQYSCTPETMYLPPSGAGSFQFVGHAIRLKDTVAHTAEFDWTLILNGDFSYTFDGVHLVLVQQDQEYQRHRRLELTRQ